MWDHNQIVSIYSNTTSQDNQVPDGTWNLVRIQSKHSGHSSHSITIHNRHLVIQDRSCGFMIRLLVFIQIPPFKPTKCLLALEILSGYNQNTQATQVSL